MKENKFFLISLFVLSIVAVVGVFFNTGLSHSSPVSQFPSVMVAGLFGSIWGGIKKVGGIALKVAPVIPGVGTVVAGAAAAVGALGSGGQVQTVTPPTQAGTAPTVQTIGTYVPQPQIRSAGFGGDLMNYKLMGIPIVPVILIGFAVSYISRRRR